MKPAPKPGDTVRTPQGEGELIGFSPTTDGAWVRMKWNNQVAFFERHDIEKAT